MKIILGSASEGRKKVMQELGLDFEIVPADIDEKAIRRDTPEELVLAVANAKADALVARISEPALLITSDQVILCEGELREKPRDVAEARKFLQSYNSSPAHAVGAVTVTNSATGKRASGMQKSTIYFKPLPDDFTEDFIKSGKAFKYAGGFPVQDSTWTPYIERIEGGWDTAAGLSKELLADLVKKVV
ncbi:MAG TPA: Maf family protein [Candidatus Paceibacterota bacterium]